MSDFVELLFDLFIEGTGILAEKTSSKAKGKSGAAYWISIVLIALMTGAMAAYFAMDAYACWQAGDLRQMWLSIVALAMMAVMLAAIGLRRLIRWYKKRQETMYDPKCQK